MYFCEDNLFVKVKLTNKALGVNITDNEMKLIFLVVNTCTYICWDYLFIKLMILFIKRLPE